MATDFDRGYRAGAGGMAPFSCPYTHGPQWFTWMAGWCAGREASTGQEV